VSSVTKGIGRPPSPRPSPRPSPASVIGSELTCHHTLPQTFLSERVLRQTTKLQHQSANIGALSTDSVLGPSIQDKAAIPLHALLCKRVLLFRCFNTVCKPCAPRFSVCAPTSYSNTHAAKRSSNTGLGYSTLYHALMCLNHDSHELSCGKALEGHTCCIHEKTQTNIRSACTNIYNRQIRVHVDLSICTNMLS